MTRCGEISAVLMLLCAMQVASPRASAASPKPEAPTAYQLSVNPGAFRIAVPEKPAPPPPPIPAALADKPYAALIHAASLEVAVDPALVHALIYVESRYNAAARSPKGAIGLMQVMPDTARRYGISDVGRSPEINLRAGTRYLRDLMQMFDNRLELVLAAYNAGENAVLRHGERIPPYPETQAYVPAVLAKYQELREPDPVPDPPSKPQFIEYLPGTRLDARRAVVNP